MATRRKSCHQGCSWREKETETERECGWGRRRERETDKGIKEANRWGFATCEHSSPLIFSFLLSVAFKSNVPPAAFANLGFLHTVAEETQVEIARVLASQAAPEKMRAESEGFEKCARAPQWMDLVCSPRGKIHIQDESFLWYAGILAYSSPSP